jgi:hypothetical protein
MPQAMGPRDMLNVSWTDPGIWDTVTVGASTSPKMRVAGALRPTDSRFPEPTDDPKSKGYRPAVADVRFIEARQTASRGYGDWSCILLVASFH